MIESIDRLIEVSKKRCKGELDETYAHKLVAKFKSMTNEEEAHLVMMLLYLVVGVATKSSSTMAGGAISRIVDLTDDSIKYSLGADVETLMPNADIIGCATLALVDMIQSELELNTDNNMTVN